MEVNGQLHTPPAALPPPLPVPLRMICGPQIRRKETRGDFLFLFGELVMSNIEENIKWNENPE
jgi:hypothetical protein